MFMIIHDRLCITSIPISSRLLKFPKSNFLSKVYWYKVYGHPILSQTGTFNCPSNFLWNFSVQVYCHRMAKPNSLLKPLFSIFKLCSLINCLFFSARASPAALTLMRSLGVFRSARDILDSTSHIHYSILTSIQIK